MYFARATELLSFSERETRLLYVGILFFFFFFSLLPPITIAIQVYARLKVRTEKAGALDPRTVEKSNLTSVRLYFVLV